MSLTAVLCLDLTAFICKLKGALCQDIATFNINEEVQKLIFIQLSMISHLTRALNSKHCT